MKQIKIIILKPSEKTEKTAEELRLLLENDWIIVNQDRTQNAIVYILVKMTEEMMAQLQSRIAIPQKAGILR